MVFENSNDESSHQKQENKDKEISHVSLDKSVSFERLASPN